MFGNCVKLIKKWLKIVPIDLKKYNYTFFFLFEKSSPFFFMTNLSVSSKEENKLAKKKKMKLETI